MLELPACPVRRPLLLLLLPALAGAAADIEVGFCDSGGNGFYQEQPADQLERWERPCAKRGARTDGSAKRCVTASRMSV